MTGSSIFDYIHHQDHSEIAEQLGLGLSQGQNLASPGSGSEESTSTAGTNNPDGKERNSKNNIIRNSFIFVSVAHTHISDSISQYEKSPQSPIMF